MANEPSPLADYRKGFNEGYLITKHLPELSEKLSQLKNATERIEGFQDGRKQLLLELVREQRPQWLNINQIPHTETDRGKDELEPDQQ